MRPRPRLTWLIRERDKAGWRIPIPGTLSAEIYHMSKRGMLPREIAVALDGRTSAQSIRVLLWGMRHWQAHNVRERDYQRRRAAKRRATQ